jgi:hypothetical protein
MRLEMKQIRKHAGFALVIAIAMALQIWAATEWPANFDSDEAVNGMIALRASKGDISLYFYGQGYLGAFEPLLSGLIIKAFGAGVMNLRIVSLLFFGVFLMLHAILINRFFGPKVALLSLLILAFPSWKILLWTFRPISGTGALLIVVTSALILSHAQVHKKTSSPGLILLIGILVGFGLWLHPITVYYFFIMGYIYLMQIPEWASFYDWLIRRRNIFGKVSLSKILPFITIGGSIFVLVMLFIVGNIIPVMKGVPLFILFLCGVYVVYKLYRLSNRRRQLISGSFFLICGMIMGNLPQWGSWLFLGVSPSAGVRTTDPESLLSRFRLLYEHLLPAFWGVPPFGENPAYIIQQHSTFAEVPLFQKALWLIIILIIFVTLIHFLRSERKTLGALISLRPLSERDKKVALIALLFFIPMITIAFAGNAKDMMAVRYLIPAWQGWSVILALFFYAILEKKKVPGYFIIGFWLVVAGIGNVATVHKIWNDREIRWYTTESVEGIKEFLDRNGIEGGYTDWWNALALNYLTEEQYAFAGYGGGIDAPELIRKVETLPVLALLFCPYIHLPDNLTQEELIQMLREGVGYGRTHARFLHQLRLKTLVSRQRVANWDVWVFEQ